MKKNDIETELNRIRVNLYEETKDLTIEQRVKRSNELAEKLAKEYGFTILPSTKNRNISSENLKSKI